MTQVTTLQSQISGVAVYLAIDPGSARTGFALANEKGEVILNNVIKGDDAFLDYLEGLVEDYSITHCVVEVFRNRPGRKETNWSKNETSQIIGAIKRILRKAGIKIVEQEPSPCLDIGMRFLNMADRYRGKHIPDQVSALAHLTYFLRKEKILA